MTLMQGWEIMFNWDLPMSTHDLHSIRITYLHQVKYGHLQGGMAG